MVHSQRQRSGLARSGMTFIELIVVVLIIGLLIGLGSAALGWISKAKRTKTQVALNALKFQIIQYHTDTNQYPNTLFDLLNKPSDPKIAQRWHQYVSDENELKDAWGNVFAYQKNPAGPGSSKRPYELYSWGADGEGSTEGHIDVWAS